MQAGAALTPDTYENRDTQLESDNDTKSTKLHTTEEQTTGYQRSLKERTMGEQRSATAVIPQPTDPRNEWIPRPPSEYDKWKAERVNRKEVRAPKSRNRQISNNIFPPRHNADHDWIPIIGQEVSKEKKERMSGITRNQEVKCHNQKGWNHTHPEGDGITTKGYRPDPSNNEHIHLPTTIFVEDNRRDTPPLQANNPNNEEGESLDNEEDEEPKNGQ